MGYVPAPRQTTPDFLVSVTDIHARSISKEVDFKSVPKTADALAKAFQSSKFGKQNANDLQVYRNDFEKEERRERLKTTSRAEKTSRTSKKSSYNISYLTQIRLSLRRRFQLEVGDAPTFMIKNAAIIFQALIISSAFYNMPVNTSAFFSRGGLLFFAILFVSVDDCTAAALVLTVFVLITECIPSYGGIDFYVYTTAHYPTTKAFRYD